MLQSKYRVIFINESKLQHVNDSMIQQIGECLLVNVYAPNDPTKRLVVAMEAFNDSINSVGLTNFLLSWGEYMWFNLREFPSFSRLDRFLLYVEFVGVWSNIAQQVLLKNISDHNPISLSIMKTEWGPKLFRWFNHLKNNKDCVDVMEEACRLLDFKTKTKLYFVSDFGDMELNQICIEQIMGVKEHFLESCSTR
ncbi:hypothetical protein GQ457_14G017440 [Hibiscus cannabinus]